MKANRVLLKLSFFALTLLMFLSFTPKRAYAALGCGLGFILHPIDCTFQRIQQNFENIDVRRTVIDISTSAAVDVPSNLAYGRSFDELGDCFAKIRDGTIPEGVDPSLDCTDLEQASVITGKYGFPTSDRSYGSLMGIATVLQDVTQNEAIPINLAYYGKHMAAKVPVLNQTAYAADPVTDPFDLRLFMNIWEKLRNLSYGVLAIFMLGVGVMVMLRQKINPQTVITVQAAIPRIIIAVILITFSYPIASLAIQLINPLSRMAVSLLTAGSAYDQYPFTTVITMPMAFGINRIGHGGLFAILIAIIIIIVTFILLINVLFKIFLTYIKIVFSVLIAPFTFAWGAIPGNETTTLDWFKQLAVYVLTVPAMFFGMGLALYTALQLATTISGSSSLTDSSFQSAAPLFSGGDFMVTLAYPLVILVILLQVGKIPQQLEEMILGRESKPKKK